MGEFPKTFCKAAFAVNCSIQQKLDTVTVLNCTYADLSQSGAEEKHRDAARRAYSYFKNQSYQGLMVMVMVDSSAQANTEMIEQAQKNPNFRYFHLPDRDNVPEAIEQEFPHSSSRIRPSSYFETSEFNTILQGIKLTIDSEASNPLDNGNNRPPLGSKRNFGIEAAKQIIEDRGLSSDVIVYFDDDVYGSDYIKHAVDNLQNGHMFTAETSYYVAVPKAKDDGSYNLRYGEYIHGQDADTYTWLNGLGHRMDSEQKILSTLPFGFTYAVRTEAWEAVNGVADILRGEDRSLYLPIREKYGENAINLRAEISGQLLRLTGDNNSNNATTHLNVPIPEHFREDAMTIYQVWEPVLTAKFKRLLQLQDPDQKEATAPRQGMAAIQYAKNI